MTFRNILIALVTACIMAWTIQARAQHSGPPGNSAEEECKNKAHLDHCDCWLHCNDIPDDALRIQCKDSCGETEKLEMSKCDAT